MTDRITVAVIDNHEIVRDGVTVRLSTAPDLDLVRDMASVDEYFDGTVRAAVVLLDLLLDEGECLQSIPTFVRTGAQVLLYTSQEKPVPLQAAVALGAAGLLLKSDPSATIIEGIRDASAGEFVCSGPLAHALLQDEAVAADLSGRQVEILERLDEGLTRREVSHALDISEKSVGEYLARIRDKYRAHGVEPRNSHHLTRLAFDDGYLRRRPE